MRSSVPVVVIDMRFADYQQLSAARDRALRVGTQLPSLDGIVEATVTVGAQSPVSYEVRLPGGSAERLEGDAWPLELRPVATTAWMHLEPIDEARSEFAWQQWAYLDALAREGMDTATQTLVRVALNGAQWGLYLLETPAPAEVRLRFDAQALWEAQAAGANIAEGAFRYAVVTSEGEPTFALDVAASRLRAAQRGDLPLSEVCDAEVLGRFFALTMFWTGQPAPDWRTLQWGFDSSIHKLVPLGAGMRWPDSEPLPEALLDDPVIQAAYVRALGVLAEPAYLERLRDEVGEELEQRWAVLGITSPAAPWEALAGHQERIRALLAPRHALAATLERDAAVPDGGYVLLLANLQRFPLLVVGLDAGGAALRSLDREWVELENRGRLVTDGDLLILRGASGDLLQPVRVRLPWNLATAGGDALAIVCRVWGSSGPELRIPVTELTMSTEGLP